MPLLLLTRHLTKEEEDGMFPRGSPDLYIGFRVKGLRVNQGLTLKGALQLLINRYG